MPVSFEPSKIYDFARQLQLATLYLGTHIVSWIQNWYINAAIFFFVVVLCYNRRYIYSGQYYRLNDIHKL